MKIVNRKKLTEFQDLSVGSTFEYNGDLFIKINEEKKDNAFNIECNEVDQFPLELKLDRKSVEIHIMD